MDLISIVAAVALGYLIGLLQNGIRIYNDYRPDVEIDEDGNPEYNKSISILDEEQRTWIEKNREV